MLSNWHLAKVKFSETRFPERTVTEKCVENSGYTSNRGETHEVKNNNHTLQTYVHDVKVGAFLVSWKYNYCPECQKVINKYGALLNNHDNTAYVKWFIRNGKSYETDIKAQSNNKKANIGELVNEFNSEVIGGDLDD